MTLASIPFVNHQASGQEELSGASPVAVNIMIDGVGAVRRRPGIINYAGAPTTAVDTNGLAGIYCTVTGDLYAVGTTPLIGGDRPIYHVTSMSAGLMGNGAPPAGLRGQRRPIFAEAQLILAIAGGEAIEKVVIGSLTTDRLGGSPPFATHVLGNQSRLLVNPYISDNNAVAYSDVFNGASSYAGAENWVIAPNTAGAFEANAKPDPIVALAENSNNVFVFGNQSLQLFAPDPNQQYAPVNTVETGCSAPYSIIRRHEEFFFLNHQRQFVHSDGRTFSAVSEPIQRTLEGITTISDCFGMQIRLGAMDGLLWIFPTDGRAFCLQGGGGWSEWLGWSDAKNNWAPLNVMCGTMRTDTSYANLVGTSDGKVGQFSFDTNTDLGTRIRAYVETGYQNHQTDAYKFSTSVKLKFRRGTTASATAPAGIFGWRDRPGDWAARIPVSLGASGDTEPVVEFRSLGTYRTREWMFEFSGTDDFVLVGAEEDFTVLGN